MLNVALNIRGDYKRTKLFTYIQAQDRYNTKATHKNNSSPLPHHFFLFLEEVGEEEGA